MGKDKEVHGLFKVPDSAIIENQAKEIGMLKSEIDELKYELEELKKEDVGLLKKKLQSCNQSRNALKKQLGKLNHESKN